MYFGFILCLVAEYSRIETKVELVFSTLNRLEFRIELHHSFTVLCVVP